MWLRIYIFEFIILNITAVVGVFVMSWVGMMLEFMGADVVDLS